LCVKIGIFEVISKIRF